MLPVADPFCCCLLTQTEHSRFTQPPSPHGRRSVVRTLLLVQIMAMSTMKDHERLELLKEIGGTKVYEERRKESLKILHETDNRRSRILEVVGHLDYVLHRSTMLFLCRLAQLVDLLAII